MSGDLKVLRAKSNHAEGPSKQMALVQHANDIYIGLLCQLRDDKII